MGSLDYGVVPSEDGRASHKKDDVYLPCCAQAPLHVFACQTSSNAEKAHFEMFGEDFRFTGLEEEIFIYVKNVPRAIDT